ncbi:Pyrimidine-specific ribonucleoside hydrolase RihA [Coccomyxa sp. Obi]|nr:Pyrimidine-specific ribonucleoside hydrolase RihA [Coccomyxa sp. Obi]
MLSVRALRRLPWALHIPSRLPTTGRECAVAAMAQPRTKLWIDCDAGVDDAQGLLLALAAPNVDLIGISTVHGNVGVAKVVRNVARILKVADRLDVPFYLGSDEPLLGQPIDAAFFHGQDGLGDVPDVEPALASICHEPLQGIAALKLIEAAREHTGELVIAAIGPLTNLALACKLDLSFPGRIKALYVMGGAERAGNVTPASEFNFHCDPEAAHLVLKKFPRTVLLSWEGTIAHAIPWETFNPWIQKDTARSRFIAAISAASIAYEHKRGLTGWIACDPLAVAVAIRPELIEEAEELYCAVELHGSLTRGMSTFDWNKTLGREPNVALVRKVNLEGFNAMMDASTD